MNGLLKIPAAPKMLILTPQPHLLKSKQKLFGNKWLTGIPGKHLCLDTEKGIYISSGWGFGSPVLISICEEFRSLGTTSFLLLGVAGRLSESLAEGEAVRVSSAISEEGTSNHYITSSATLISPMNPFDLKGRFPQVCSVSTDAPFRETSDCITRWRAQGADVVDMETSALFAFANFYSLQAGSVLITADSLTQNKWQMITDMKSVNQSLLDALEHILSQ